MVLLLVEICVFSSFKEAYIMVLLLDGGLTIGAAAAGPVVVATAEVEGVREVGVAGIERTGPVEAERTVGVEVPRFAVARGWEEDEIVVLDAGDFITIDRGTIGSSHAGPSPSAVAGIVELIEFSRGRHAARGTPIDVGGIVFLVESGLTVRGVVLGQIAIRCAVFIGSIFIF